MEVLKGFHGGGSILFRGAGETALAPLALGAFEKPIAAWINEQAYSLNGRILRNPLRFACQSIHSGELKKYTEMPKLLTTPPPFSYYKGLIYLGDGKWHKIERVCSSTNPVEKDSEILFSGKYSRWSASERRFLASTEIKTSSLPSGGIFHGNVLLKNSSFALSSGFLTEAPVCFVGRIKPPKGKWATVALSAAPLCPYDGWLRTVNGWEKSERTTWAIDDGITIQGQDLAPMLNSHYTNQLVVFEGTQYQCSETTRYDRIIFLGTWWSPEQGWSQNVALNIIPSNPCKGLVRIGHREWITINCLEDAQVAPPVDCRFPGPATTRLEITPLFTGMVTRDESRYKVQSQPIPEKCHLKGEIKVGPFTVVVDSHFEAIKFVGSYVNNRTGLISRVASDSLPDSTYKGWNMDIDHWEVAYDAKVGSRIVLGLLLFQGTAGEAEYKDWTNLPLGCQLNGHIKIVGLQFKFPVNGLFKTYPAFLGSIAHEYMKAHTDKPPEKTSFRGWLRESDCYVYKVSEG